MKEGRGGVELSEDDLALINALQIAPRLSWSDAADVLGVHATTLASRWDRLRAAGASWTTAHLIGDPKRMCLAFVAVDCEMNRREQVTASLAAVPEIVTVEEAASNRDLMLTVVTRSLEEFSTKVVSRLKETEGLVKYQTALCTRLHSGGGEPQIPSVEGGTEGENKSNLAERIRALQSRVTAVSPLKPN